MRVGQFPKVWVSVIFITQMGKKSYPNRSAAEILGKKKYPAENLGKN